MKYYSEILNKFFDSVKECLDAEEIENNKKKDEEQSTRKAEVDCAYNAFENARNEYKRAQSAYDKAEGNYNKLKNAYVADYGSYTNKDGVTTRLFKPFSTSTSAEDVKYRSEIEKLAHSLGII